MTLSITVETTPRWLRVHAAGPAGLPELLGLLLLAGELAQRRRLRLALAELSQVTPSLSFTDHLQLGVRAASSLASLDAVAVVVPPGYLETPSEKAAQRAGLNLRTFLQAAPAQAWLEGVAAPQH